MCGVTLDFKEARFYFLFRRVKDREYLLVVPFSLFMFGGWYFRGKSMTLECRNKVT
jgi:hypothetical protein